MSRPAGMVWFVLLAVLGARADEPAAPLENSKQELKALQKEPSTHGGDAPAGKLRDAMPQLQAPGSPVLPVEPPAPRKSETQLNREARKNWLLDGMDRLEKSPNSKNRNTANKPTGSKDEHADPNEPNYLLNLYGEQQRNSDDRIAAKQSRGNRKDPLTPFLQDWLADSPVRGKFFDEYIRKRTSADGSDRGTSSTLLDSGAPASFGGTDRDNAGLSGEQGRAGPATANPYLQTLDMSALQEKTSHDRPPAATAAFQPPANQPPAPLVDPGLAARQPDKKPPMAPLAEDNKYFPQLKKF